jgi:hypothetical protein
VEFLAKMLVKVFRKPKMLVFDHVQQDKDNTHLISFSSIFPFGFFVSIDKNASTSICYIFPHTILELAEQQLYIFIELEIEKKALFTMQARKACREFSYLLGRGSPSSHFMTLFYKSRAM